MLCNALKVEGISNPVEMRTQLFFQLAWWKIASELRGLSLIFRCAGEEGRRVNFVLLATSTRAADEELLSSCFLSTGISSRRFRLSTDLNRELRLRRLDVPSVAPVVLSSSPEVTSDSAFVISDICGDDSESSICFFSSASWAIASQFTDCTPNSPLFPVTGILHDETIKPPISSTLETTKIQGSCSPSDTHHWHGKENVLTRA